MKIHSYITALAVSLTGSTTVMAAPAGGSYDVIVYGATGAGVFAAYSAAKQGKKVALIEPTNHLGGMVTGGLSATDLGKTVNGSYHILGGYTRKFYTEAASHYGKTNMSDPNNWLNEPHVASDIYWSWLNTSGVDIHLNQRISENTGVTTKEGKIASITTEDNQSWSAKVFVDGSYEGDMMTLAGVASTVGRESTAQYNESLAGVRTLTPKNQFLYNISATEDDELYPGISSEPLAQDGAGDNKVQAYNYRIIISSDADNKLPWLEPEGYNRTEFELLGDYVEQFEKNKARAPVMEDFLNAIKIPNQKADVNNDGGFSTDYIGMSWDYPEGSYDTRSKIWNDHLRYTKSFFYFMSHDEQVPESVRTEFNSVGRAKDEFQSTDNWPPQLYVREARRMLGPYVMTQKDLQTERTKDSSIAMGSYNSDSHNVQRVVKNGFAYNEGDVQVSVKPYDIPYEMITPKQEEVENLLVPVCFSSSHCAFSSIRMEPQYMMIGEAAGTAAALAAENDVAVQNVDVSKLQDILRKNGGVIHVDEGYP